jgi:hypothetical protein
MISALAGVPQIETRINAAPRHGVAFRRVCCTCRITAITRGSKDRPPELLTQYQVQLPAGLLPLLDLVAAVAGAFIPLPPSMGSKSKFSRQAFVEQLKDKVHSGA